MPLILRILITHAHEMNNVHRHIVTSLYVTWKFRFLRWQLQVMDSNEWMAPCNLCLITLPSMYDVGAIDMLLNHTRRPDLRPGEHCVLIKHFGCTSDAHHGNQLQWWTLPCQHKERAQKKVTESKGVRSSSNEQISSWD